jgi:hypothetical protein
LLSKDGAELHELRGIVASGDNELLSTFYCALQIQQHSFKEGLLAAIPRWSEPVLGFVARCLASVDFASDLIRVQQFASATLSVVDARRGMRKIGEATARPGGSEDQLNPWQLVRDACLVDTYGCNVLPPTPTPLEPPVRLHESVPYCRLSDLPEDANFAANWVFKRAERLRVGNLTDAVTPQQMHAFLSNNVDVPRPFQGWLWP